MRKLLLTTTLVLPLAVVVAQAQDSAPQPTDDPAAITAPMAEPATDPMADPMPAASADPMSDPTAAPDAEDSEKAALEATMATSDKVAREQAANELRLDWITNADVTAPDGTKIGDITDLIVDGQSGQMIAATIGVGGFLGIGAKQIAVPWDQLTVNYDAQEITSDLTKAEAEAAPEYLFRDRESAPSLATDAVAPAADPMATGPMATDPMAADPATAPPAN